VLVGKPNAGKSSLFNALLQEERAIVHTHPGTTRDTIEESISIGGVLFRLTDTAGLREAETSVEAEGVKRTRSTAENADIVVLVIDAADRPDIAAAREIARKVFPEQRLIVAYNKADLIADPSWRADLLGVYALGEAVVFTSARNGNGIDELKKLLLGAIRVGKSDGPEEGVYVTNERHYRALVRARRSLTEALESLHSGRTNEFVAFDIREATQSLSEITGQITTDDILNSIFSKFCIGK